MMVATSTKALPLSTAASRLNVTKLLVIGLVFHVLFIGSVFDCYFTSPVVSGMESFKAEAAESKRLVLIVGDGLRADLLFNTNPFPNIPGSPETAAPYLRAIVQERGAFGISHTRVPTESRPGHVAIIGGMYEDVSAVTKGWKTNPVDFDSVFNQSSNTFSFGSPDILPMFARGATPGKVKTWSYNEEDEDFTKDATALDFWVIDQLRTLFRNATTDSVLNSQLRQEKTVIFLHLLGLDTTGHSYRPHSKEYMHNIEVVDSIVQQTESLFSDFYQDGDTSFIFTADHGMSNIGNHGDGHPDSTRTPLIAWGKGIRGPLSDSVPSSHDEYSQQWNLGHLLRRDLEQADIAPLMCSLIGINWPVNSVGVLPDVDPSLPGYLNPQHGDETRARLALINAKMIIEGFRVKHELKKAHTLLYKPYKSLEGITKNGTLQLEQISMIENLIESGKWSTARQASYDLIKTGLDGLHYLQTYDRFLIKSIVIAAYTGWVAYAAGYILNFANTYHASSNNQRIIIITSWAVLLGFWVLFTIQRSPGTFYLYIAFPCYFWQQALLQGSPIIYAKFKSNGKLSNISRALFDLISVFMGLQGMVVAYTHRSVWSVGFVLIGIVWPFLWPERPQNQTWQLKIIWGVLCLITAIFPLLSVDKKEDIVTILFGGFSTSLIGCICAYRILKGIHDVSGKKYLGLLFTCQIILILLMMGITTSSVLNLQNRLGLPKINQISGWIVLLTASAIPIISNSKHHNPHSKLLMYFLGFGTCFVILSISVELLFYVSYSATLFAWIHIEKLHRAGVKGRENQNLEYRFQPDDVRIALFFLFFVQVGFFGTGNVASISSFYLEPVYRLIPIFNPFFMAALLTYKIIAPYVILAIILSMLNHDLNLPPLSLLLVALTLTDGMTLTFFFNVQDTGSWLEIGQSITFFCLSSLLLLWSAGICALGEYLMSDVMKRQSKDAKQA